MSQQCLVWIFLGFLVIGLVMCISLPKKEGYVGWNGGLSGFVDHYSDALKDCERADGTLFQGEFACSQWVNSQYNYIRDHGLDTLPRDTSLTQAREHCGENVKCIDDFFAQQEMMKWCAQHCQWKTKSTSGEECKEDCFRSLLPNSVSFSGWTYK